MHLLSFSKKDLSFDFLSNKSAIIKIFKSSKFLSNISFKTLRILSVALFIIITFSFSNKDFEYKFSKKLFFFSTISFSS